MLVLQLQVYELTRKNPKTGFKQTIWGHQQNMPTWTWTGKTRVNDTATYNGGLKL